MMEQQDLAKLVELTNKLDEEGHTEEAKALDSILVKFAEAEEKEMTNKAKHALEMLHKACQNFCSKNLDVRGPNRRKLNKVCDMAEDLCAELEQLIKNKE